MSEWDCQVLDEMKEHRKIKQIRKELLKRYHNLREEY